MSIYDACASGDFGRLAEQDSLDLASRDHYGCIVFDGSCSNVHNICVNHSQLGGRLSEDAS
jgi:hypothetical protein